LKYTYFWSGPFSQWTKSEFVVDGIKFCTAEQFMMWCKAKLFEDDEIAEKILNTQDPKMQKALGRKVKNFDAETWNMAAKIVVYKGNYAKFTQNPKLLKVLMATEGTYLVEASPYDKIWGIGLNEADARKIPACDWPGTNWLGMVLTQLRNDLLNQTAE
jgi:ribA/ribD-fused uncharacterized protein